MKVDMSPEAIWGRIKLVDALWELTTELRRAGQGPSRPVERPDGAPLNDAEAETIAISLS